MPAVPDVADDGLEPAVLEEGLAPAVAEDGRASAIVEQTRILRPADRALGRAGPSVAEPAALVERPLIRFWLGPADRPQVAVGARVAAGDPLLEQAHDPAIAEAHVPPGLVPPEPGLAFDRRVPLVGEGRHSIRFDAPGRVLYQAPGGLLRVAVDRGAPVILASPVSGTVVGLDGSSLVLEADGVGLPGLVAAGRPASGTLALAVADPADELASAALDVSAGGRILVAGSRIDVEALGRARATGVRGVVCGGAVSRDVRRFDASERRQRANVEAGTPFAMLVLDGYGKRPIPPRAWALLRAAEGQEVAILIDPPLLVLPDAARAAVDEARRAAGPPPGPEAVRVRCIAGPELGRSGWLLGPAGRRPAGAGLEAATAWVLFDPLGGGSLGNGGTGGNGGRGASAGPDGTPAPSLAFVADLEAWG